MSLIIIASSKKIQIIQFQNKLICVSLCLRSINGNLTGTKQLKKNAKHKYKT